MNTETLTINNQNGSPEYYSSIAGGFIKEKLTPQEVTFYEYLQRWYMSQMVRFLYDIDPERTELFLNDTKRKLRYFFQRIIWTFFFILFAGVVSIYLLIHNPIISQNIFIIGFMIGSVVIIFISVIYNWLVLYVYLYWNLIFMCMEYGKKGKALGFFIMFKMPIEFFAKLFSFLFWFLLIFSAYGFFNLN